jgi:3-oxoadipate enol-lactonase
MFAAYITAVVERMTGMAAKIQIGMESMRDFAVANNIAASSLNLVGTVIKQMISAQDPRAVLRFVRPS